MGYHYKGYSEAVNRVEKMNEQELLTLLNDLFGTGNLPCNPTIDDLRREALDQVDKEWTDPQSEEYELVQFYSNLHKAMQEG